MTQRRSTDTRQVPGATAVGSWGHHEPFPLSRAENEQTPVWSKDLAISTTSPPFPSCAWGCCSGVLIRTSWEVLQDKWGNLWCDSTRMEAAEVRMQWRSWMQKKWDEAEVCSGKQVSSSIVCTLELTFGGPTAQGGWWVHFIVKKARNLVEILSSHRLTGS